MRLASGPRDATSPLSTPGTSGRPRFSGHYKEPHHEPTPHFPAACRRAKQCRRRPRPSDPVQLAIGRVRKRSAGQGRAGGFAVYTLGFDFTPRRVFRALRSTFIAEMIKAGASDAELRDLLGQATRPLFDHLLQNDAVGHLARRLNRPRWPLERLHYRLVR